MSDEIKEKIKAYYAANDIDEILDLITDLQQNNNNQMKYIADLLVQITNLQQENEEWEMIFDTFSNRPYAHKYLEEKRKELGNDNIIGLDSEMIYKDYYDYKSRCKKTIESLKLKQMRYVNESDYVIDDEDLQEEINILQNGSEKD